MRTELRRTARATMPARPAARRLCMMSSVGREAAGMAGLSQRYRKRLLRAPLQFPSCTQP
eukprot:scaffold15470_cov26-Prasinocladus_malaysianus.AAC.2